MSMSAKAIHSRHPSWSADDIWYFLTGWDYVDEDHPIYQEICEACGEVV
jgi:hypothetical protein